MSFLGLGKINCCRLPHRAFLMNIRVIVLVVWEVSAEARTHPDSRPMTFQGQLLVVEPLLGRTVDCLCIHTEKAYEHESFNAVLC